LVYWYNEIELNLYHKAARSYRLHDKSPAVLNAKSQLKTHVLSAVTNKGKPNFMILKRRAHSETFLKFLSRLAQQSTRKVLLILDNHIVHRSTEVRSWIEKNGYHIRLFFLPNPVAHLKPDEGLS
jgi:hypothetical protein